MILRLCKTFRCTPDEAYRMPARVLRLLEIERLSAPVSAEGGEY